MTPGNGRIQKHILILLAGGASLACASFSPKSYFKTLRVIDRELSQYRKDKVLEAINRLYASKLIGCRACPDGSVALTLRDRGRKQMLRYRVDEMRISTPRHWDGKWRMVLFDIPKRNKKTGDILRFHLKRLGFYQFQKSVFAHPYPCTDEINFLIELHGIRRFVRQMVVTHVDNELDLKRRFNLL
jgi:DNA-binding transcriptional regulator PaaX